MSAPRSVGCDVAIAVRIPPHRWVTAAPAVVLPQEGGENRYWLEDTNLILSPNAASLSIEVVVSHVPPLPSSLSDGFQIVVFVEPYEMLLSLGTAVYMLTKGGAETDAAAELKGLADAMRGSLLTQISRRIASPQVWRFGDFPSEWGG